MVRGADYWHSQALSRLGFELNLRQWCAFRCKAPYGAAMSVQNCRGHAVIHGANLFRNLSIGLRRHEMCIRKLRLQSF